VKVAFVLGTSAGGTGRHVRMLAAGCAARGVRAEVFGPPQADRDFGFAGDARGGVGFTAVSIGERPRVPGDLRTITRLRRLLRAWRPDVVHAHGLRAGALTAIAVAVIRPTAYDTRPALVVTVHNAPPAGGVSGAIYRVLELIVARTADSVLCVSADTEQRMLAAGARRVGRAVVPAARLPSAGDVPSAARLPSAGDVPSAGRAMSAGDVPADPRARIRAEFGAPQGQPIVLGAGRLAPQKGFGLLLDAAARWGDIRPEPLLVIAGEGPLAAGLRSRAASLGLAVRFTGHRSDIPSLLAAADVFVLPSTWEGQSLILQEALRAGLPVVATRVGGNAELTGEDAAVLVPPGDPQRLADAVRAVLGDPALAARLRQAAADRSRALPGEDEAVAAALAEYLLVTPQRGR
jgi:glycosyltransferase involved in cell wall biosynthesis